MSRLGHLFYGTGALTISSSKLSCILFFCTCFCAAAGVPKYYSAQIGVGTQAIHATYAYSDCNGPFYSADDFTASYSTLTLVQGISLTMSGGQWIPATAAATGPSSLGLGQSSYITTLAISGVVTTYETGTFTSGAETAFVSSIETVDLNTGNYNWRRVVNHSLASSCAESGIDTQQRTGYLPITTSVIPAPTRPSMIVVNPFSSYLSTLQLPTSVDASTVLSSNPASGLAADGLSAVVVAFQSNSSAAVSLAVTAPGLQATASFGSLTAYNPGYLATPNPGTSTQLTVGAPAYCAAGGTNCVFLALLWSPAMMPVSSADLNGGKFQRVMLSINATQGNSNAQAAVMLLPPPLVLVHDTWSSADQAWPLLSGFVPWIESKYAHNLISRMNYGPVNSKAFSDPAIQNLFLNSVQDALASSANAGIMARQVDVVAHGTGGLVVRYFQNQGPPVASPILPSNPIHNLITIGTPHQGTPLANLLAANASATNGSNKLISALCSAYSVNSCTLSNVMALQGQQIDTGIVAMEAGLTTTTSQYNSILGQAPTTSASWTELDTIIGAFIPGASLVGQLGTGNDSIVTIGSQGSGANTVADITGIVHNSLTPTDVSETASPAVWAQTLYWLMGGVGQTYESSPSSTRQTSPPSLNLSGYTQVAASNVTLSPPSNAVLVGNLPSNITAASSTKTITQFLLFQKVVQPTDLPLQYASQAPFAIPFLPGRLGLATLAAIVLFSDQTFAVSPLQYSVQPIGNPLDLKLSGVPATNLAVGGSANIAANAGFSDGILDVSQAAAYTVRSGGTRVVSVSPGGAIAANGTGVDWLDVLYNGVSASAQITVGACSYQLSPSNQVAANSGASVTFQVATAAGCSWTASSGAPWLTSTNASGLGSGAVTFTASPNTTGLTRQASILIANQDAVVIQPASACSYSLSPSVISAPPTGGTGNLSVSTTCPAVASSSAPWLTAVALGSSVDYTVAPNSTGLPRNATLAVGTQAVPASQSGQGCTLALSVTPVGAGSIGANPASAGGNYSPCVQVCLSPVASAGYVFSGWSGATLNAGGCFTPTANASVQATFVPAPVSPSLLFVPVTPCRIADTRNANGPFGGPFIAGGTERDFAIPSSSCGIPSTAKAYSVNLTVVPSGPLGYATIWPSGQSQPAASTLNSGDGRVKANAAIVPSGANGSVSIYASNSTNVILDINGYFVGSGTATALAFYPLTPCRILDTRNANGSLGGPSLAPGLVRDAPIRLSSCNVPPTAQAYSLNLTAVPQEPLGFVSVWPAGQTQPIASTLNATTGQVTANAAIVPAGINGDIDVLASHKTNLIMDINGYFAPPGAGGLSLYTLTPCRMLDTRTSAGAFGGELTVNVAASICQVPNTAQTFVLNATVVPSVPLGYLSLWPDGGAQPQVSTLNSSDGAVTSNMAIVPANNWSIDAFASNPIQLILDLSSYFAP